LIQVPGLSDLEETHRIRVSAEGHRDQQQEVKLTAGQIVEVEVALTKQAEDS
jgi:hypothetical protein